MAQHVNPAPVSVGKSALKTILFIGLVAGTFDILAAFISTYASKNVPPIIVLQYIASGWFGKEAAFSGGAAMAMYGLLFHYLIAITWTLIFFLVYPYVTVLAKHKIIAGLCYGIVVWIMMNVVIIPLTNVPNANGGIKFPDAFIGMGILMIAIGLPISILVHRYYKR
jgi:uncharacterized membrane protein YagU involved in acid resistance